MYFIMQNSRSLKEAFDLPSLSHFRYHKNPLEPLSNRSSASCLNNFREKVIWIVKIFAFKQAFKLCHRPHNVGPGSGLPESIDF